MEVLLLLLLLSVSVLLLATTIELYQTTMGKESFQNDVIRETYQQEARLHVN